MKRHHIAAMKNLFKILRTMAAFNDLRPCVVAADESLQMFEFVTAVGFGQKNVIRTADIFHRFTQKSARQDMTVAERIG